MVPSTCSVPFPSRHPPLTLRHLSLDPTRTFQHCYKTQHDVLLPPTNPAPELRDSTAEVASRITCIECRRKQSSGMHHAVLTYAFHQLISDPACIMVLAVHTVHSSDLRKEKVLFPSHALHVRLLVPCRWQVITIFTPHFSALLQEPSFSNGSELGEMRFCRILQPQPQSILHHARTLGSSNVGGVRHDCWQLHPPRRPNCTLSKVEGGLVVIDLRGCYDELFHGSHGVGKEKYTAIGWASMVGE